MGQLPSKLDVTDREHPESQRRPNPVSHILKCFVCYWCYRIQCREVTHWGESSRILQSVSNVCSFIFIHIHLDTLIHSDFEMRQSQLISSRSRRKHGKWRAIRRSDWFDRKKMRLPNESTSLQYIWALCLSTLWPSKAGIKSIFVC